MVRSTAETEGRPASGALARSVTGGVAAAALLAVTVLGTRVVLHRQAAHARRLIGKPLGEVALDADRVWGRSREGDPVDLLILGDSIAAGLGAERPKDVLGARLSKGLSRALGRPVRLRTAAVVGSESAALEGQLDDLPHEYRADAAVVIVGGNDVTHRTRTDDAARQLGAALDRLRARGAEIVVGTCPDLGALRPVPQPLRSIASRASRQLADAQSRIAQDKGARVVSLRRTVGPLFLAMPAEMFSLDRFHPSALGYRRTAEAILPELVRAFPEGRRA